MKIICITGHCGTGKTTAIKIMEKQLPNSAVVRGDKYWIDAILKHQNEFEEIYHIPLDMNKPYECLINVSNDSNIENKEKFLKFFCSFAPFIEKNIEEKILECQKSAKDFILVEYVTLPMFQIWKKADFRIMITSNREKRHIKIAERTLEKRGTNNEDEFAKLRENVFARFIENINDVDITIYNKYNNEFAKELIELCDKINT